MVISRQPKFIDNVMLQCCMKAVVCCYRQIHECVRGCRILLLDMGLSHGQRPINSKIDDCLSNCVSFACNNTWVCKDDFIGERGVHKEGLTWTFFLKGRGKGRCMLLFNTCT